MPPPSEVSSIQRKTKRCANPLVMEPAVTSFEDFLAMTGCTTGTHSLEVPLAAPKPTVAPAPTTTSSSGTESYGAPPPPPSLAPLPAAPTATAPLKPVSTAYVEEQDDPDVIISAGAPCKRKACGKSHDGSSRAAEECLYHPGGPVFHEGSKGYSCCKRRTLDFDEFMAIEGCRKGKHLFVGAKRSEEEEMVECRIDHYQTPREVIVSVFGKGADKEVSKVVFEVETVRPSLSPLIHPLTMGIGQMHVDLVLPGRKRFLRSFALFGPIDPAGSSYKIVGTKCEVILAKADARSWPSITPSLNSNFVPQLAFSAGESQLNFPPSNSSLIPYLAGGGRGTTGAKTMVLDEQNKAKQSS